MVLAMGTGLGTGLLVSKRTGHEVLALEGGHTLMNRLGNAHPDFQLESQIFDHISKKL